MLVNLENLEEFIREYKPSDETTKLVQRPKSNQQQIKTVIIISGQQCYKLQSNNIL